jgi:hypothetical protein
MTRVVAVFMGMAMAIVRMCMEGLFHGR